MQRETTISRWCERITEACWLLALTLVPIFFNLYSARHFEPDKAVVLRTLALIAVAAALIRWLDGVVARTDKGPPGGEPRPTGPPLWRRFAAIPLAVPALLYALVFLFTTATSVVPATSFWGSYQRLQGTYTNLSYIMLFAAIVATLRRREQLERIVSITLCAGAVVAGYGVLQHLQLDPLPWRGDVITRVASTMGNSIFVAAYMIMVVPFALYRAVSALSAAREAPAAERAGLSWGWAATKALLLFGGVAMLLTAIKFGAAVRTVDFRYWWVLPGAVVVATALWWLLTTRLDRPEGRLPLWPGLLLLGYLLAFGLQFAFTAGAGLQRSATIEQAPRAVDWPFWLFAGLAAVTLAYGLAARLPRLAARPSRLDLGIAAGAAGLALALLLAAIFFTQSRGPWIGLGAGLFVFISLLLWQAMRHARATEALALAGRLRALLIGWVVLTITVGGFLLAFNTLSNPLFDQLRQVPYLGRMGRLLEVDSGTGLVRRLIWAGDEHAGGAIGLIASDPLRAVIGWGPESMFVAYNPFYPPALANIEARGASPDRSHQAILDEVVTKGFLGLASYLFLLFSAVALAWRLIRRSEPWHFQVLFIACLSTITANFVEGLTGIPIVSTLMMLWVTLGVLVSGGAVAGHYRLSLAPEPAAAPEAPPEPAPAKSQPQPRRRQPAPKGAAARGGAAAPRRSSPAASPGALLAYGVLAAVVLGAAWWWNLSPIYADMHFQQGQGLSEQANANLNSVVGSVDEYLQTIRSNPREDFYYLNLGRALMTLAEGVRSQGVAIGEAKPKPDVGDLLRLGDQDAIVSFVQQTPPQALMGYAEAVLLRAHDLNPRNKDHYANLGRLNSFWYAWTEDPARLRTSLDWYERVTPIAPQDVTLLNERAGVVQQLGDYAARQGDQAAAKGYYDQARELLDRSKALDPRYSDTYQRLGDLIRSADGDLDAATDSYVEAIRLSGVAVANSIERISEGLAGRPDLILRLRDAYVAHTGEQERRLATMQANGSPAEDVAQVQANVALLHSVTGLLAVRGGDVAGSLEPYRRAAELQPTRPDYSRNYSIVLSDTRRYDEALAEARRGLQLQQGDPQAAAEAQQLVTLIEQARGRN
jgi:tetratricopeptide (TPR) repeat protein